VRGTSDDAHIDVLILHKAPTRAQRRRTRQRRRWAAGVAALAIGLGVALLVNIAWFYVHSDRVGHQLVEHEAAAIAAARARATADRPAPTPTCAAFNDTSTEPEGLLEAPTIGLQAPVLPGDSDSQLDVAVGHVSGSTWPGQPGTMVLAAHDVTYFSGIDGLGPGDQVTFVTPCATYRYQVTGHAVVAQGTPLYSSNRQTLLVLETCYPLNALYLTSQRYLVTAQFVSQTPVGGPAPSTATYPAPPTVPAPAPLAAQGLTLATNDAPLGVLGATGTPTRAWLQSPAPLADEAAVLADYFAAVRAAEQEQPSWWAQLAYLLPNTDAAPLRGATIEAYTTALESSLAVSGDTLTGATLSATVRVHGRLYQLTVVEQVANGALDITSWTMAPA